jgi:hypothetical protein
MLTIHSLIGRRVHPGLSVFSGPSCIPSTCQFSSCWPNVSISWCGRRQNGIGCFGQEFLHLTYHVSFTARRFRGGIVSRRRRCQIRAALAPPALEPVPVRSSARKSLDDTARPIAAFLVSSARITRGVPCRASVFSWGPCLIAARPISWMEREIQNVELVYDIYRIRRKVIISSLHLLRSEENYDSAVSRPRMQVATGRDSGGDGGSRRVVVVQIEMTSESGCQQVCAPSKERI